MHYNIPCSVKIESINRNHMYLWGISIKMLHFPEDFGLRAAAAIVSIMFSVEFSQQHGLIEIATQLAMSQIETISESRSVVT